MTTTTMSSTSVKPEREWPSAACRDTSAACRDTSAACLERRTAQAWQTIERGAPMREYRVRCCSSCGRAPHPVDSRSAAEASSPSASSASACLARR
jgi:hypothetical protein